MKPNSSYQISLGIGSLLAAASLQGANFLMWEPTPYRSQLDSPFYEGIQSGTIFLEDFEDGSLNTPYVRDPLVFPQMGITFRTLNPGIPDGTVASVDGDDGFLDIEGDQGNSWVTFETAGGLRSFFEFAFAPNEDGQYPTFVGIVVTQIAEITDEVDFGVYGESGLNLATSAEFDPRLWFNMNRNGDVETHRFIGFYAEEGIRRFRGINTIQVDHLQYGYAIPEPSVGWLSALSVILLFRRRR